MSPLQERERTHWTSFAACVTLGLASLAVLAVPVCGQTYPVGVPQISISPPNPTTNDVVFVTIRGTHNDSCVPEFEGGGYGNFVIQIDLVTWPWSSESGEVALPGLL